MAPQPLIPESQLLFSAELAATVGLPEAVLLQQIKGLYLHQPATRRDGLPWLHVSRAYLMQLLPFWSAEELQTVCDSLESLGLLNIDRKTAATDSILLAINEKPTVEAAPAPQRVSSVVSPVVLPVVPPAVPSAPPSAKTITAKAAPDQALSANANANANVRGNVAAASPPMPRPGKREGQPLPPDFQPSEDMLELLERFHGVPRGFALQQIEDFTLYWRERGNAGHAWQNRFKQHVQFQWARQQQEATGIDNAGQRGTGAARRTRDSSLESDLTDTSWAE